MNKIKSVYSNPLFKGSFVMIAGSMTANMFNYIYHLVMGKMLGPIDYGILASIFSVLYIVSVVPLSTSVSIVKFVSAAKSPSELSHVYQGIKSFIWKVAIIGSVILLLSSSFIARFLHINDHIALFFVAPIFFFSLIALINQSTSQGLLKFNGVVLPNLVSSIVKLILGVLLIVLGFSVDGAILAVLVGITVAYLLSISFVKNIKKVKVSNFNLRPFLQFSGPALLQALAFTSIFTTDLILVKHFLPEFEAGLYAALSTLGKIIYFASSPVTQVMFPIVSGKRSRGESYKRIVTLSILANLIISTWILIFYTFFPKFVIGVLYGEKYLGASSALFWMGLFISLYTACQLLVNYALSVGKTKIVIFPFIAAIVQVVAIVFFHSNILQVIQVSLAITVILLISIIFMLKLPSEKVKL